MGFLGNLDKVNTLEMFLTDKGKELMLKENGLGLFDLISRFSLDDADYDYRRTSNVWVDGISPVPDGSLLPFGTTQGLTNNSGGPVWFDDLSNNNPCRSCDGTACAPLSGDCWYDMPDVRGDRGKKIISCFSETGKTQGVKACTNIYAFYDVTSVARTDADAAKTGLESWFSTISATTPNYVGKLFHIAVFGERWINTSWYPWNGKLDAWKWTPCGNGEPGAPLGYNCDNNSSTFLGNDLSSGAPLNPDGSFQYRTPITGLYLQADDGNDSGVGTGDWTGFNVLPPNASVDNYGNGTGSIAEFWTTGCTLISAKSPKYDYNNIPAHSGPITGIPVTAYSSTNIVFATTAFTGTIFSGYTPNDFTIITSSGIPGDGTSNNLFGNLPINLCEENCCPDRDYNGPGLFGCQECNPFDNTITSGKIYKYENKGTNWTYIDSDLSITAGTMDLMLTQSTADCVKYRGMDRNVLVVDIFDETQGGEDQAPGPDPRSAGILPLGYKTYYVGDTGNAANTVTTPLGNSGGELSPNWALEDNTGYHGKLINPSSGVQEPPDLIDNWDIYTPGNQIQARQQQPTEDYKYSQDLFLKTHGLYENFQGFIYPVVPLDSSITGNAKSHKMVFPLHLYGALYGEIVPLSEFQDNPTVVAVGGTLSACTINNPYDVLIPVTYDPTTVQLSSTVNYNQNPSNLFNWEPFNSADFTAAEAITPIFPYTKGMKNFGWDFNPTVGCSGFPCNVGDIFSGGTFQNDLNGFITGSSFFITTTLTACTECQCLPAVFINKKGPIEVVDDGCPCPDGTISEECCDTEPGGPDPDNPITQGICGPLPSKPTHGKNPNLIIGQSGQLQGPGKTNNNDLYLPKSYMDFRSGKDDSDTGIGANLPPLKTTSKSHNYSSFYTVDFNINLQQYYEKNKLKWDVEFESTSRYGDYLIQEGDGSKFYWMVSSGYKTSKLNPKETKACISPTVATINLNKRNTQGVNIAYLRGYWDEKQSEQYSSIDTKFPYTIKKESSGGEIQSNLFTNGGEYLLNGENYVGSYHVHPDKGPMVGAFHVSQPHEYLIPVSDPMMKYEFCITMAYTYNSKLLKKTKRFSVIGNQYGYKLKVKA